jgi:hypothetical protein
VTKYTGSVTALSAPIGKQALYTRSVPNCLACQRLYPTQSVKALTGAQAGKFLCFDCFTMLARMRQLWTTVPATFRTQVIAFITSLGISIVPDDA